MWYDEHTVEPDIRSCLAWLTDEPLSDGEFISMKRGRCYTCGRPIDFDADNAWHVEYEQ
jgi:hypothetical protein